ncbi:MAG: tyrosine-type recombinase/integrase [Xanthobacteraceae bacterium]
MVKRAAANNALTFERLAERYIDEYAKPRKSSWRNDRDYLKRPREKWGEREAASISRRDVISLLDEIKQSAPVSANRTQSVLVTLFNWAVEDELLDGNPITRLKKRAKEKARDRTLSDDELRLLWRALDEATSMSRDVGAALQAILLTGQRPGEVAGAVQAELRNLDDPNRAQWEIPAARMGKTSKTHVVPLAPMARELFLAAIARRKVQEDRTGVFASRFLSRKTLARHSLSRALSRSIEQLTRSDVNTEALQSLKATPPTPHDLRRTVTTNLAALGIPREDRLAVTAHQPADVHGLVYDKHDRLHEKRVALSAWERHLARVLGKRPPKGVTMPRPWEASHGL